MQDKERLDFSLSVTPGPSDYERRAGAYVYWKELGSESEKPIRFEFRYRCTHEWTVSPTHIELGHLAAGKKIGPIVIELKRIKGANTSVKDLIFDSQDGVEVHAADLPVPQDTIPEGDVAREMIARIKVQLPTPKQAGGYVHSVSVSDRVSNRVEVVHISGTVASTKP
jgi:hypothetical protein